MEPFYNATTIFSGSNYPTLNLIYLTMTLLIKEFAPSDEETEDDYIELLFEPLEQEESQMNDQSQIIDNNSDIDNEIEPMITKEQLQQPLQVSQGRERRQERESQENDETSSTTNQRDQRFKDRQIIASPVTTEGLHNLVKAASYLSLQEYWKITTINKVRRLCIEEECCQPSIEKFSRNESFNISTSEIVTSNDFGLIVSFLDPRIKSLKFLGNTTLKITIINKVQRLCIEEECRQPSIEEFFRNESFNISTSEIVTSNDLMAALYRDEESDDEDFEENELDHYLLESNEKKSYDPLTW
ncbi:13111_t:CDS:2 [Ambispora gerdemannii]|uniref:13111_t:CDS:1 n=1 Tax=Ambispora gerdemannii TaxID=144530 RepID=A0A9N9HCX0_9GLOM|nr:13111_t:CDS:2 [Ambispora gerdemannii]